MHGAPVQCNKGKCPKAFHVSCARENTQILFEEFEIEQEVIVDTHGDGSTSMDVVRMVKKDFQLLCVQHNPVCRFPLYASVSRA
jgi:hypothetical protein